jgi:hypothetical protein
LEANPAVAGEGASEIAKSFTFGAPTTLLNDSA